MNKFPQGGDVILDIYIFDYEGGNLVDPDGYPATEPTVTVIDQLGVTRISNDLCSMAYSGGKGRIAKGHYSYKYTLPIDAPKGNQWHFQWGLTVNGFVLPTAEKTEYFEVVDPGYISFGGPVTSSDIRDFLEGYCGFDATSITDKWIDNRITKFVVPYVENVCRMSVRGVESVVEYISGNGKNVAMLSRRPIVEVTEIRYVLGGSNLSILNLGNIEVIANEGVLKAKRNYEEAYYLPVFAKGDRNIKVTYRVGYDKCPDDLKEAIIYLTCEQLLGFVGARTGGGSFNVQGVSKNYGQRGKFQDVRNDLARQAYSILKKYSTGIVAP